MTDTKQIPIFPALRTCPIKAREGVWITHPETRDQLRVRRMWCTDHVAAYLAAARDYDEKHGAGSHKTEDGAREVEAVGLATGVIVDWKLTGSPDRSYDPAAMVGALVDPALQDLAAWVRVEASMRANFTPSEVTR